MAEPGERSIPPAKMTIVLPIATSAVTETWSAEVAEVARVEEPGRGEGHERPHDERGDDRPDQLLRQPALHAASSAAAGAHELGLAPARARP